ncbi:fibronectin type III-like domain-contianing protein [Streptomyces sp. NPDC058375]|uniref:fibronectin type III-like domain-contianing protein n=1 Tax=Streptomyces sp. NPDC058375 TaxID=3346467 RepID=UPI00364DF864
MNPELYEEAAGLAAAQLRSRGGRVALVSALDLVRDPRWGRAKECFGEDPYLAARFTEALVRGVQGPPGERIGPDRAAVVLKHFAGQGATVGGRNSAATELGLRELHEIHLEVALAGVRAGAAGAMALAAGTDLSLWDGCFPRLAEAVEGGLVDEAVLVQLYVRRVLGGSSWPRVRELRGFDRVALAPGERAEVSLTLDARVWASVSRSGERLVEPGEFAIEAGPSSDRAQGVRLTVRAATPGGLPGAGGPDL